MTVSIGSSGLIACGERPLTDWRVASALPPPLTRFQWSVYAVWCEVEFQESDLFCYKRGPIIRLLRGSRCPLRRLDCDWMDVVIGIRRMICIEGTWFSDWSLIAIVQSLITSQILQSITVLQYKNVVKWSVKKLNIRCKGFNNSS